MGNPKFYSWMFDSRSAWESTINDPAYHFDMPVTEFYELYRFHKTGVALPKTIIAPPQQKSKAINPPKILSNIAKTEVKSELLEQKDIDELIAKMFNDK